MIRKLRRYADAIILVVVPALIISNHIIGWRQLLKELSIYIGVIIAFFILRAIYKTMFAFIKSLIKSSRAGKGWDKIHR